MGTVKIEKISRGEAFRYMAADGYEPTGKILEYADECEKRLLSVISPRYTFRVFPISENDGNAVTLGNTSLVLRGHDICAHLAGCRSALLLCATAGVGADTLIRQLQTEDMAKAVIADSFASAAVEQLCGQIDELLKEKYPDKFLTWRFSAGYGDFPIETQSEILKVTDASRLAGITLGGSGMLVPVKSVTAVCGISDTPLPPKKTGCAYCGMRENCIYRKRGTRCEF